VTDRSQWRTQVAAFCAIQREEDLVNKMRSI